VPNSPVGVPKLPRCSTRSPGFSPDSGGNGWTSEGFLARSESWVAPGCDSGGCGAVRSLGIVWVLFIGFHERTHGSAASSTYSIGLESGLRWSELLSPDTGKLAELDGLGVKASRKATRFAVDANRGGRC
jgi:hypothetical protein